MVPLPPRTPAAGRGADKARKACGGQEGKERAAGAARDSSSAQLRFLHPGSHLFPPATGSHPSPPLPAAGFRALPPWEGGDPRARGLVQLPPAKPIGIGAAAGG